jgi:tetratricopeptide (TPR) repeat protein
MPDGQWMKKEWYRKAEIRSDAPVRKADLRAMDEAVSAVEEKPDSRDRQRRLVRALSRVGNLERVRKAIDQWIERDAHDPEALTYLSDAAGRAGNQALALRLLSGVVDLAADDVGLHRRLARAFERAGMAEHACAHRETLAELESDDPESLAAAIRCFSGPGRDAQKQRALARITDEALRTKVEALAATPATLPEVKGDLLLVATWEGKLDLDLSLITPQGTRVSWMGGRVNVVGDGAREVGKERLGFAHVAAGTYMVEIARTSDEDKATATGTVVVEALESGTKIPFTLSRDRMVLGQITVRRMSRLVPQ